MDNAWTLVIDLSWLSLFILIANLLKRKVKFFDEFIIPTSIVAGFTGLILGPEVLKIIPLDINRLGRIVYHLMAIGFIALSLKDRKLKRNKNIVNSGILIVTNYLVQGIIGFGITLILFNTIYPDLFPGFGLLLPLGYGQGPGQAYSIGRQWEALGFIDGSNIGLTISTFGFLWASLGGVPLMNYLIRKGKISRKSGKDHSQHKLIHETMAPEEIPLSESLDKISMQVSLIGLIYITTYFTLVLASNALNPLGGFGKTFAQLLWGFHFNIGSIYGLLFRFIIDKLENKKLIKNDFTNNYLLQRIAGGTFDFMITASIAAISIYTFRTFVIPIILVVTLGGAATMAYNIFMCKRLFKKDALENIVGFYGMMTGTISTGMALLKGVDPDFKTNAAENLVLGSAVALMFGLPLMVVLNIPIMGYLNNKPVMYLYTLILFIGYLVFLLFLLYRNNKKD